MRKEERKLNRRQIYNSNKVVTQSPCTQKPRMKPLGIANDTLNSIATKCMHALALMRGKRINELDE